MFILLAAIDPFVVPMATENHRETLESPARLMVQEVWSRGDIDLVDDLVTEDYVQHDVALPEAIRGPEALKEAVRRYREGTPDLTKTIGRRRRPGPTASHSICVRNGPARIVSVSSRDRTIVASRGG